VARGWESKEIESQMEAAEARAAQSREPRLNPEELRVQRERESLELSRTRVLQDLAAAKNPKYRELLGRSLRYLDEKLAGLPDR
jgi:hypothetical protein